MTVPPPPPCLPASSLSLVPRSLPPTSTIAKATAKTSSLALSTSVAAVASASSPTRGLKASPKHSPASPPGAGTTTVAMASLSSAVRKRRVAKQQLIDPLQLLTLVVTATAPGDSHRPISSSGVGKKKKAPLVTTASSAPISNTNSSTNTSSSRTTLSTTETNATSAAVSTTSTTGATTTTTAGAVSTTAPASVAATTSSSKIKTTPTGKLMCSLCASTFGRRCELKRHIGEVHTHNGARRFRCNYPMCNKSFTRRDALAKHNVVKHQGKRRFVCPTCSEKFTSRYDLSRHSIRVHSSVKKRFTCEHCAAGFSQKSQLTMHKGRVHAGLGAGGSRAADEDGNAKLTNVSNDENINNSNDDNHALSSNDNENAPNHESATGRNGVGSSVTKDTNGGSRRTARRRSSQKPGASETVVENTVLNLQRVDRGDMHGQRHQHHVRSGTIDSLAAVAAVALAVENDEGRVEGVLGADALLQAAARLQPSSERRGALSETAGSTADTEAGCGRSDFGDGEDSGPVKDDEVPISDTTKQLGGNEMQDVSHHETTL